MLALFISMLFKFIGHGFCVDAGSHKVMMHVAQHADNLCGQRFIQNINRFVYIAFVTFSNSAIFHLINGAAANLFNVSYKMRHKFLVGRGDWDNPNKMQSSRAGCLSLNGPEPAFTLPCRYFHMPISATGIIFHREYLFTCYD